jgi:galactonate dehydratase
MSKHPAQSAGAMSDTIKSLGTRFARISPKTIWTFVEIEMRSGTRGTGEATLFGAEHKIVEHVQRLQPSLCGLPADAKTMVDLRGKARSLDEFAVLSTIDQALWDIRGQAVGTPIRRLLGTPKEKPIPLYANINRRTEDRTPEGFAKSARFTVDHGFSHIKIAPFDGVTPENAETAEGQALIRQGLDRIAATCDTARGRAAVMVDCHWRFTPSVADVVLDELASIGVVWYECPLPENPENFDALRALRRRANDKGMRLAGCETESAVEGFRPFLERGIYDVIMPDVKYAGGCEEILAIAALAREHGISTSLHNPTGPICHAASLQLSSLMPEPQMLEHQFDESPLFADLIEVPLPAIENGLAGLPQGAGLGTRLLRVHPAFQSVT